ncbi:MAG: twin-arginine translocation signal domain-containing protein [Thermomicrobiales bacterium]
MTDHARTLMQEFFTGRIDRRQLLVRAAAAGVSVGALGAIATSQADALRAAARASRLGALVDRSRSDIDCSGPQVS